MSTATQTTGTKAPRKPRAPKAAAAPAKAPRKPRAAAKDKGEMKPKAHRRATDATREGAHEHVRSTDALRDAAKRYERDREHKTAGGHISVDSGDELAVKLRGKDLDAVYAFAAKTLKEDEAHLREKYAHLNIGMQRMCLGNRMRAAAK